MRRTLANDAAAHDPKRACLLAHEGREAIYRAGLGFSRVRVSRITVDSSMVTAWMEIVPTHSLLNVRMWGKTARTAWEVGGPLDDFYCDGDTMGSGSISLALYFAPGVVEGVVRACAALPAEYGPDHADAVVEVISEYRYRSGR